MKSLKWLLPILLLLVVSPDWSAAQGELRVAEFDECQLQSGDVIVDCKIGYRTYGSLEADRSNVVLFPSWFTGTTEQLARFIGPEGFVDTSRFFVIAVDAFGNGVSSSPSNSPHQPGDSFPRFTIRDMVNAQHRLLTEELDIDHLWAVIGISMGGMQAYEWLVAYPDFVEKAVAIVGSPQLTSFDLVLWETLLRLIEQCEASGCEDTGTLVTLIEQLILYTPQYRNQRTSREDFTALLSDLERSAQASFRPEDYASQLRAMLAHDVAAPFEGDLERAAATVRGELLTVVASFDHSVTPEAARLFTELLGGNLLELDSPCGHVAFSCEAALVSLATNGFLAAGR